MSDPHRHTAAVEAHPKRARSRALPLRCGAVKVLVNYATPEFARYRRLSSETARRFGGFDRVLEFSPADLGADFRRRNARMLRAPRGGGCWVWKPWVIERALRGLDAGDCLFYADAGVFFTGPVDPAAALLRPGGAPVLAFGGSALEREWTKRDAFVLLGCDTPRYADSFQAAGGLSAWRPCPESLELAAAWRRAAEDERLVCDGPRCCGKPEYPGFRAHRHDQSVFSLLCKRRGIAVHRVPWRPPDAAHPDSAYPAFALRGMNSPLALARYAARRGAGSPGGCARARWRRRRRHRCTPRGGGGERCPRWPNRAAGRPHPVLPGGGGAEAHGTLRATPGRARPWRDSAVREPGRTGRTGR